MVTFSKGHRSQNSETHFGSHKDTRGIKNIFVAVQSLTAPLSLSLSPFYFVFLSPVLFHFLSFSHILFPLFPPLPFSSLSFCLSLIERSQRGPESEGGE